MDETNSITALLIVTICGLIASLIGILKQIKKMKSCCCESSCTQGASPMRSPQMDVEAALAPVPSSVYIDRLSDGYTPIRIVLAPPVVSTPPSQRATPPPQPLQTLNMVGSSNV